jgi:hypothetical protein
MIQDVVVYAVCAAVAVYIALRIFRAFTRPTPPCAGCKHKECGQQRAATRGGHARVRF